MKLIHYLPTPGLFDPKAGFIEPDRFAEYSFMTIVIIFIIVSSSFNFFSSFNATRNMFLHEAVLATTRMTTHTIGSLEPNMASDVRKTI